jgi:hypothetical protein
LSASRMRSSTRSICSRRRCSSSALMDAGLGGWRGS